MDRAQYALLSDGCPAAALERHDTAAAAQEYHTTDDDDEEEEELDPLISHLGDQPDRAFDSSEAPRKTFPPVGADTRRCFCSLLKLVCLAAWLQRLVRLERVRTALPLTCRSLRGRPSRGQPMTGRSCPPSATTEVRLSYNRRTARLLCLTLLHSHTVGLDVFAYQCRFRRHILTSVTATTRSVWCC